MNRRDLWWLGVAVLAGLAVVLAVRQMHDPFAAVASPDAVDRGADPSSVGPATQPSRK